MVRFFNTPGSICQSEGKVGGGMPTKSRLILFSSWNDRRAARDGDGVMVRKLLCGLEASWPEKSPSYSFGKVSGVDGERCLGIYMGKRIRHSRFLCLCPFLPHRG